MVNNQSFYYYKKNTFFLVYLGEINYVRGCINQIQALRPEMPTVRENGCWTAADNYIVCCFFWVFILKKSFVFFFLLGSCLSTMVCVYRGTYLLFLQ
jgi:hypothetical protein